MINHSPSADPPSVLLVDDEPEILSLYRYYLEALEVRVHQATNLADAFALCERLGTSLTIAVVDGLLAEGPSTPLLLWLEVFSPKTERILASGSTRKILDSLPRGFRLKVLEKPFTREAFASCVSSCLESRA